MRANLQRCSSTQWLDRCWYSVSATVRTSRFRYPNHVQPSVSLRYSDERTHSKQPFYNYRQLDHRTTRITTRRGRNRRTVPTDPNITVYVGDKTPIRQNYIGEGHFYIVYGQDRLPRRLARVSELRIVRTGVNPEIWGSDRRLMRTIGA